MVSIQAVRQLVPSMKETGCRKIRRERQNLGLEDLSIELAFGPLHAAAGHEDRKELFIGHIALGISRSTNHTRCLGDIREWLDLG
jgi:hypothetical protein